MCGHGEKNIPGRMERSTLSHSIRMPTDRIRTSGWSNMS